MKSFFVLTFFLCLLVSCGEEEKEDNVVYRLCDLSAERNGSCERYWSRNIVLPNYNSDYPGNNEIFHIQSFIDAVSVIEENTDLGEGYHRFSYKDEELLLKPQETEILDSFETNVEFWSDEKFNALLEELPQQEDPNAIWVYNRANKRQFWLVFRSSCFESNNISCTNDPDTLFTPDKGTYALVARTMARFVGTKVKSCDQNQSDPMCANFPNDLQWNEDSQARVFGIIDNGLELIRNDLNFYEVFNP